MTDFRSATRNLLYAGELGRAECECEKAARIAALEAEVAEFRKALRDLVGAIDLVQKAGCIDHIDCLDDAPAWYMALSRARGAISEEA